MTAGPKQSQAEELIVFDGQCVLCSHLFHWVVTHDRAQHFKFATAQSPLGQRIYQELGLGTQQLNTMVVVRNGQALQRMDAVAAVLRQMPGFWPVLACVRHVPRWIKDPAYGVVARNRYRLFGRRAQCLVPDHALRQRFANEGFAQEGHE